MATKTYKIKRKVSATESEEIQIPASSVVGLADTKVKNAEHADSADSANKVVYQLQIGGYETIDGNIIGIQYNGSYPQVMYLKPEDIKFAKMKNVHGEVVKDNFVAELRDTGVTAGQYNNVTVDEKGRVTSAENVDYAEKSDLATVATSGSYNDLSNKPTIPSAVTSVDGLSGGTLTSPLKVTGGDGTSASKIALNQGGNGQITDSGTSTIFGFMNSTDLTMGSASYNARLRGKETRPKYNGNDLALKSDVPSVPTNYVTTDTAQDITGVKDFYGVQRFAGGVKLGDGNTLYGASDTSNVENYMPRKDGTLAVTDDIPTKTSELTNDSGFLTGAPSNMVTTNTAQTISGGKTFTGTNTYSAENTFTHATYAPTWHDIANGIGKSSCFTRGAFMQAITGQILAPNAAYSESAKGYNTEANKIKFQKMTASNGQPTVTDMAVISESGITVGQYHTPVSTTGSNTFYGLQQIESDSNGSMFNCVESAGVNGFTIFGVSSNTDEDDSGYVEFGASEGNSVEMRLNGNAGTSGQVLTSQGADKTPIWKSPAIKTATLSGTTLTLELG